MDVMIVNFNAKSVVYVLIVKITFVKPVLMVICLIIQKINANLYAMINYW